jgi:hypothetical protein
MESVAVLTNHLRQMLVDNNWTKPSSSTLDATLAAYQAERLERMKHIFKFSSNLSQGWSTLWYKILSTWILPMVPDRMLAGGVSSIVSSAPTLDFVEVGEFPSGRMPWKYEAKSKSPKEDSMISTNQ